jgi:hypothetical protein
MIFVIIWLINAGHDPWPALAITFMLVFPVFGVAIIMIMQLFVFPFEYSCFGKLERTPFPHETPLSIIRNSAGAVAGFKATIPLVTWYLYHSGLGVYIFGVGKAFIPADKITEVSKSNPAETYLWGSYMLRHTSKEIYNPVYFYDKKIFSSLTDISCRSL